jgi:hypothetical protein
METLNTQPDNKIECPKNTLSFCHQLSRRFEDLLSDWNDDPRSALGDHAIKSLRKISDKKWLPVATWDERTFSPTSITFLNDKGVVIDGK